MDRMLGREGRKCLHASARCTATFAGVRNRTDAPGHTRYRRISPFTQEGSPVRLRGIPGSANKAQAAHASAARSKKDAPRLPPVAIDKAAGASWDAEGGQLPEAAKKAT
jgi:hypothetical protein